MSSAFSKFTFCTVGDVHGHLQMALSIVARWQMERSITFDAVFLCGDVATFTTDSELDNATRRHARANPCELEFLTHWASKPPAPWLEYIFRPLEEDGLGLACPVVMVHGNHEGFPSLAKLAPQTIPSKPVHIGDLPTVDSGGFIRYLPSGWRIELPTGHTAGGLGGIEEGQRASNYHPMAYLDEAALLHLIEVESVDFLFTHQGPKAVQGDHGSETLDLLLPQNPPKYWFHGHSSPNRELTPTGPADECLVVPLETVAFPARGPEGFLPRKDGWSITTISDGEITVERENPYCLREFRLNQWFQAKDGRLVSPALATAAMCRLNLRLERFKPEQ